MLNVGPGRIHSPSILMIATMSDLVSTVFQFMMFFIIVAAALEAFYRCAVSVTAGGHDRVRFYRAGLLAICYFVLATASGILVGAHHHLGHSFQVTTLLDFVIIFFTAFPAARLFVAARFPPDVLSHWITSGRLAARPPKRKLVFEIAGLFLICVVVSVVPLFVTSWQYGPQGRMLQELLMKQPLVLFWLILRAPFSEELLFRGYVFPRFYLLISRRLPKQVALSAAAVASAVIFASGHTQLMLPEWLKLSQAFLLGLALAYVAYRGGLLAAVLFHIGFNALAFLLSFVSQGLLR